MDTNLLTKKFEKLGARAKVRPMVRNRWHRVAMNTENQSRAMASVAFLD